MKIIVENDINQEQCYIIVEPDMLLTHHALLKLNFNQQISNQIRKI